MECGIGVNRRVVTFQGGEWVGGKTRKRIGANQEGEGCRFRLGRGRRKAHSSAGRERVGGGM